VVAPLRRTPPPGKPTIITCPDCRGRIALTGWDDHKLWACNPDGIPKIIVLAISERFAHYEFAQNTIRNLGRKYPEIEIRMPKGKGAAKELAYFIEAMELNLSVYKSGGEWEASARNRAMLSGVRHYEQADSERIGKRANLSIIFSAGTSTGDAPWNILKAALRIADPVLLYKETKKQGILRFQNHPSRLRELGDGVQVLAP
jgi:hypothetical protein